LVRIGGVAPDHPATEADADWGEQPSAAHLVVPFRRESGDYEVAVLAEQEEAVAVAGYERRAFVRTSVLVVASIHRLGRRPQSLPGGDAHRTEQAIPVDAVGDPILYEGSTTDRGEPGG